jgi:TetR/AcrR family transcriptional regulator, tetracycline repressor protein
VARPKTPLISKREVVRQALAIVDAEGMEALSIRRLGEELNVNGASLYHHFENKDEILVAVGRAVLGAVVVPPVEDDPVEWLVKISKSQRQVFLRHPQVIPLLSRGYLRMTRLPAYDTSRQLLVKLGVPRAAVQILLDSIEAIIVGNVIVSLMPDTPLDGEAVATSAKAAAKARAPKAERGFELVLRSLIAGVLEQFEDPGDLASS